MRLFSLCQLVLALFLSEAALELPLASSESHGGSWHLWGRGREDMTLGGAVASETACIQGVSSLAAGGNRAHLPRALFPPAAKLVGTGPEGDGPRLSVVCIVCPDDAKKSFLCSFTSWIVFLSVSASKFEAN